MRKILILLLLATLFYSCTSDILLDNKEGKWTNNIENLVVHNDKKTTIQQGIYGTLIKVEGNCMPVIDENSTCKSYPVKRNIVIYEYTKFDQTERDEKSPVFFTKIHTSRIKTVVCDDEGFFQASLPKGVYSVFIEENGLLYANGLDGYGGLCPVEVKSNEKSSINLRLSYAVY